ncbi:HD domain-containing phosphohydrolase [Psychrobium sp. nBUS_13]|uniref:HD domain-containing phosphohydrolase n=1 Tax=Psychrobium sp. nBUS_13 TaxID=3395319 RepID=UPI003EBF4666
MNNEELIFSDSDTVELDLHLDPWKVLIVDDEHSVHTVTRFALNDFSFAGKRLHFHSVYSGKEAREYLANNDIAVVLLDVVMETSNAGLETVQWIRNELKNTEVRIILRTGQPGEAPEKTIISEYDINDYREKSELTSKKLYTVMCASLRSYRDIESINKSRRGLKKIIDASPSIFARQSFDVFAQGALEVMASLIQNCDYSAFSVGNTTCIAARQECDDWPIIASIHNQTIDGSKYSNLCDFDINPNDYIEHNSKAKLVILDKRLLALFYDGSSHRAALYIEGISNLSEMDCSLIELFVQNLSSSYQNLILGNQIDLAQKEITYVLGEVSERRSKETGQHVKRVALISSFLAEKFGLDNKIVNLIEYAAPLHDVGKIAIPDSILNKEGPLQPDEWEIMKTHAAIGGNMFKNSDLPIFEMAAEIAGAHHEKWDGSGYPNGLKGEKIPISARALAIADVFDALSSERCYKKAWCFDDIKKYLLENSGKQFDPKLIAITMVHWNKLVEIRKKYPD